MEFNEFEIGKTFLTPTGLWKCTDKGTRTVVAIKLDRPEPSWYKGPPFAVVEVVFDEDDQVGCILT